MTLITNEQRALMLENGRSYARDPSFDPKPVVKLFTPWANCTWLLTDLDNDDPDIAAGLADLGFGCPELGSVRISELEALCGPAGLRVERDLFFKPQKTIGDYAAEARSRRYITA